MGLFDISRQILSDLLDSRNVSNQIQYDEIPKAQTTSTADVNLRLGYSELSIQSKRVYHEMERGYRRREKEIRLSSSLSVGQSAHSLIEIHQAILNDNPELFFVSPHLRMNPGFSAAVYPEYMYDSGRTSEINRTIDDIAKRLIARSTADIVQKEKLVNDFLVSNVRYRDDDRYEYHTIVGALIDGTAVCEGISHATTYLLRRMGVPCCNIMGKLGAEPHSWNIVSINGKFYHLDVTNNRADQGVAYRYFNLSDYEMRSTHSWTSKIVCDDDSLSYHGNNSIRCHADDVSDLICKAIVSREPEIVLSVKGGYTMDELSRAVGKAIKSSRSSVECKFYIDEKPGYCKITMRYK